MKIQSIKSFKGKNIYSHKTVIKMVVDIGDLYKTPTCDIVGFNEKLLELFSGLNKHCCSLGYEGGFAQRLKEGTYVAHVTEHLILELQNIMGYNVSYGKARVITEPSLYYIIAEYGNERCGIECAKVAVKVVSELADGQYINIKPILESIRKTTVECEMGPSTKAIYTEAKRRGIPITRVGDKSLLQLGYGKYSRQIEASLTDFPSCISVDIAGNKHLTKQLLEDNDIPVPRGDIAYTVESALDIAQDIGYPVVVKPLDGNQGKGVTLNVCSEVQLRIAYSEALKYSSVVVVERHVKGKDHRILVVGDRVSAVSERVPPCVIGDGIHTVAYLVEMENKSELRGDDHEKPLTKIKFDDVAKRVLYRHGLDEHYVPAVNEIIPLRDNGNLSTGGTARDCTDEIHPYNSFIAIKAAKTIGLDVAGIDMTIEDISCPISSTNGAIIEVNAAPGLRMHLYPTNGQPRNVAGDILDTMFPKGNPYTIPIVSITGTNGKTTTTRLIAYTMSLIYNTVGMANTSGVFIGDKCIMKGDNTGPISARLVLSNKEVEAAVLETARGGIVRKGIGYDLADVGVITNIGDDHLGQDGLNTLEDMAFVKSLVIEAVKPNGYGVINADDGMAEYLIQRARSKVILFSKKSDNPLVSRHMDNGGKAVFVENGVVCIYDGIEKIEIIDVRDISITFGGRLECNIENSLAATAALHGLDVHAHIIATGLKTFKSDTKLNPGRFNIFDMGDFKVMLDYSHNPSGYSAVIDFISKLDAKRLVGVIGVPGDRLDRNIREVGELCGKAFSKVYIKEDSDLRGREPGEVAGILFDAVMKSGARNEGVEIVYSEVKALEMAMTDACAGDLIVMFYEEFAPALELVERFRVETERVVEESVG